MEKSIFFASGKDHVRLRKMLNPIFKVNNLKSMINVFEENAEVLANVGEVTLKK